MTDGRDPGLLGESLGWALLRAGQRIGGDVARALHGADLSLRGYVVLVAVVDGPPRTQIELSQFLGVDKSLLVIALDRLEERGLLRRVVSPHDRRARIVEITDRGADLARRAHAAVLDAERGLVEELANTAGHRVDVGALLATCRLLMAYRPSCGLDDSPGS